MKIYKFNIGEYCLVNQNAEKGLPKRSGQLCKVYEHKDGVIYDYFVMFSDGAFAKVKESELSKLYKQPKFKFAEKVRVVNSDEKGYIKDIVLDNDKKLYKYKLMLNDFDDIDKLFYEHELKSEENNNFITVGDPTGRELHKRILEELHDLYLRKNADYGDSFKKLYDEYGVLSVIIRLEDKISRLKQLEKNKQQAKVKDESIRDTAIDLANYAIMLVMELDRENEKGE